MTVIIRAFFGSLLGKLAATLFLAVCAYFGFGPDKWMPWIVESASPITFVMRIVFLALGAVVLLLWGYYLVSRWFLSTPVSTEVGEINRGTAIHDNYVNGKRLLFSDLFDHAGQIQGRTYVDCEFFGPSVVNFAGCGLDHVSLEIDAGGIEGHLFEVPIGRRVVGAVSFLNSNFRNCRFKRGVGFVGNREFLDEIRKAFVIR